MTGYYLEPEELGCRDPAHPNLQDQGPHPCEDGPLCRSQWFGFRYDEGPGSTGSSFVGPPPRVDRPLSGLVVLRRGVPVCPTSLDHTGRTKSTIYLVVGVGISPGSPFSWTSVDCSGLGRPRGPNSRRSDLLPLRRGPRSRWDVLNKDVKGSFSGPSSRVGLAPPMPRQV